ncbi:hypothetical protein HETIRDRAFT_419680 [Heterobasidion irregulare TC 32-1]|uniref:Uncharacterized protein n=1 Tax=Heterobasidion irregulare (strain TC 32-1) TaxID=747525 RepID=W4K418_HETIT|nr:uncharacterized protein HETIRDRAFT_419680 [Heterobasidion irregulare TC 32-1]ETW80090.1 hypothetical protein HETIRDRAFT_419680 [Heterobasidion irregulare TC 32-1]
MRCACCYNLPSISGETGQILLFRCGPNGHRFDHGADRSLREDQRSFVVFAKLKDASLKGPRHTDPRAVEYYSALITDIDRYLDNNPGLDAFTATFTDFFIVGVGVLLHPPPNHRCSAGENEQRVKLLILAVQRAGGVSMLREKLTADQAKCITHYPPRQLALSVVSSLKPSHEGQRASKDYRTLVDDLVHATITSSYRHLNSSGGEPEHIAIELVKFCVKTGATSQFSYVVACLITPPPRMVISPDSLISFVRMLKQLLLLKTIDLAAEPWRRIFVATVEGFANKFMTPKPQELVPASQLQRVGCGCNECTELQNFFFGGKDVISLAKKKRARAHLVDRLSLTEAWGVKWETIEKGKREILRVIPLYLLPTQLVFRPINS